MGGCWIFFVWFTAHLRAINLNIWIVSVIEIMVTCYYDLFSLTLQVSSLWYESLLRQCHKTLIIARSLGISPTPGQWPVWPDPDRHSSSQFPCLCILSSCFNDRPPSNQPTENFLRPPPSSRTCCSKISGWEIFPRLNFSSSPVISRVH